ncbi:gas vesicle protein GvpO [Micromonospora sp. NPDC049679]|uniref:gas vesicle protein GvpO n=1 Tax=Micromonospora sp. NPDC049679 TaxID=3155920 RepID=UPI0033C44FFD
MPARRRDREERGPQRRSGAEPNEENEEHKDDDTYDDEPPPRRRGRQPLPASLAAQAGLRHIAELSGRTPIGVTSLERAEDGWLIGVEVVEDRRIPSSTDILGVYQVEVDVDGALVAYRRTGRYPRGKTDRGEMR